MKKTLVIFLLLMPPAYAQLDYAGFSDADLCKVLSNSSDRLRWRFEDVVKNDVIIDDRFYAPFAVNPRFDRIRNSATNPEMVDLRRDLHRRDLEAIYGAILHIENLMREVSARNPDQAIEEICVGYQPAFVEVSTATQAPAGWLPFEFDGRSFFVPSPEHVSERLRRLRAG